MRLQLAGPVVRVKHLQRPFPPRLYSRLLHLGLGPQVLGALHLAQGLVHHRALVDLLGPLALRLQLVAQVPQQFQHLQVMLLAVGAADIIQQVLLEEPVAELVRLELLADSQTSIWQLAQTQLMDGQIQFRIHHI